MRNLTKEEISVKVKQVTEKGCLLLLYKTARVDAQILDETFGADRWVNDYKEIKGNLFCGIGVKQDDGQFIWKWDCGTESQTEAEKGEASDSFKRAGFKWGIGVELYTAPFIWASVKTKKEGNTWKLSNPYEKFNVEEYGVENGRINKLTIVNSNGEIVFSLGKKIKPKSEQKGDIPLPTKPAPTSPKPTEKSLKERFERCLNTIVNKPETVKNNVLDRARILINELMENGSIECMKAAKMLEDALIKLAVGDDTANL